MVNVNDSTYYTKAEADRLRAIAQNGYWGTAIGQGSLNSMKELLTGSNKKYQSKIDEGIALAVTQASIWTYGNRPLAKLGEAVKVADTSD